MSDGPKLQLVNDLTIRVEADWGKAWLSFTGANPAPRLMIQDGTGQVTVLLSAERYEVLEALLSAGRDHQAALDYQAAQTKLRAKHDAERAAKAKQEAAAAKALDALEQGIPK